MGYLKNLFISIDQLGNALSGGDADTTISGRIGYYANHAITLTQWYWMAMQFVVDTTFYPLDGVGHCHQAYHNDMNEAYNPTKLVIAFFVLSLMTVVVCLILIIPFYLLLLLKVIKPKTISISDEKHIN